MKPIELTANDFNDNDLKALSSYIIENNKLSQGELNSKFEKKFSKWLGTKYSVFVNSGSSANLLMLYASYSLNSNYHKNNKIVIPAISWSTSVSPAIQLNMEVILCDINLDTISVDLNCLENIFKKHQPSFFLCVNILGFSPDYDKIKELCFKYNVYLLEDNCESLGSTYKKNKLGTFGIISSHSFYFSHHLTTIEGGCLCTDSQGFYSILKSIREHGWDRNLMKKEQKILRKKYNIDEFNALYTFYYPSFNVRNTSIGAFLGLRQLKKLKTNIKNRQKNFLLYDKKIKNNKLLKLVNKKEIISNFAYPIVHKKRDEILKDLKKNNIEYRPIVCGSMEHQPFYYERYGKKITCPNADLIHKYGFYVPNHPYLTEEDIDRVCNIINKYTNE